MELRQTAEGVVPKVACDYLLERYRAGGVERAFVVIRRGKEDIPRHLGSGVGAGVALSYLVVDDSASVPETLDRAYPFVRQQTVVLGFPDLLFSPHDAYRTLLEHHRNRRGDVSLGLFPVEPERRSTTDMVRLDADGRVVDVEVRPRSSELELNWLLAAWEPSFTEWLRQRMDRSPRRTGGPSRELRLGRLLGEARADGLEITGVPFEDGSYLDLGTPEGLELVRRSDARWRASE